MPAELAPPGVEYHAVGHGRRSQSLSEDGNHGIDLGASRASIRSTGTTGTKSTLRSKFGLMGVARRTLGIALLLLTVFLWTVSNFLASVSYFISP